MWVSYESLCLSIRLAACMLAGLAGAGQCVCRYVWLRVCSLAWLVWVSVFVDTIGCVYAGWLGW